MQRAVGPVEKLFTTFDLGYQLPAQYLRRPVAQATAAPTEPEAATAQDETSAQADLWKKIWLGSKTEIAVLGAMLLVLTGVFFFQSLATRN